MIVERWTWKVKVGCRAEVVKAIKAAVEEIGLTPRICSFIFGPFDIVISDLEFESEEDMNKNRAVRYDKGGPALAEWHKKRRELVVSENCGLLRVH